MWAVWDPADATLRGHRAGCPQRTRRPAVPGPPGGQLCGGTAGFETAWRLGSPGSPPGVIRISRSAPARQHVDITQPCRRPVKAGEGAADAPGPGWERAASRLKEAGPGRERDEACHALVDELERAANPGAGTRGLARATRDLSGLLAGLDHAARAQVIKEAVERVYATAEHCGALGDLFGGICEGLDGDARTHAALEAVRASLLCAYVGEGELGDPAGALLGSCYGALAGAAHDSGLEGLSGLLTKPGTKAAVCDEGDAVPNMARLWRFIYDMRDVPNDEGIRRALKRHAKLNSPASGRLKAAKAKISQLVLHAATDHIMHEDYETIYTVAGESNMRLRYWLDEIYRQHGVHNDPHLLDRPSESAFRGPGTGWVHLAMAARYLILELHTFSSWERTAYKKIVKRLDVEDPGVTYKIIERREEMREPIKRLRNSFGAHIDWTFDRAKEEIDRIGLASIVSHARKVLMFQDSAYRKIPHKYYDKDPWGRELVKFDPPRCEPNKLKELEKKYEGVDIRPIVKCADNWVATYESYMCLYLTYGKYLEGISRGNDTMDAIMLATSEIYNMKYMFLELGNITKGLADVGLDMPFEPGFASRQKEYWRLRGDYAAHTRPKEVRSLIQVLEGKKDLLSHVPYDIEEIFQVMAKLERAFPEGLSREITHMTEAEMEDIERDLNGLREDTHAAFGNRFRDPHAEQKLRDAKERFKSVHEMEGGGSRRAHAGHGAEEDSAGRRPVSPLRVIEDALGKIGLKNCPEEWLDDLVCGDHAGALARIRAHSVLSNEGSVEAMPAGPGGHGGGPDMVVDAKGGRLCVSMCSLDNVPRMLGGASHVPGAGRAISARILEAARERLAGLGECGDPAALVVMDPDGAIAGHGGLEAALESVGREMPWVGALAVVGGGGCEVRGVPRASVPLGEQARAMLRALGAPAPTGGPPEPPPAARDQA